MWIVGDFPEHGYFFGNFRRSNGERDVDSWKIFPMYMPLDNLFLSLGRGCGLKGARRDVTHG